SGWRACRSRDCAGWRRRGGRGSHRRARASARGRHRAPASVGYPRSRPMRALKIIAIVLLIYAGIVAAFESLIGTLQPAPGGTLVITTFDGDGTSHDRAVSRLATDGH